MTIDPSGNVGIGTTAPSGKLEVIGNVVIGGSGTLTIGGLTYTWPGSQSASAVLTTNGSGTLSWNAGTGSGSIGYWNRQGTTLWPTTNTDTVTTLGNLGVGTTTPLNRLDVSGSAAIGSLPNVVLPQSNMLYVSGNVGIGTTTPSAKLQISGGGLLLDNNQYIQAIKVPTGTVNILGINASSQTVINSGSGNPVVIQTGGTTRVYIQENTGNVGIGTILPGTARLSVMGGNVGIGTSSPAATLDVTGSLQVSGITTFNGIGYTWPASQGSSQVLTTNGAGSLSWSSVSGVGGVTGTGNTNFLARWNTTTGLNSSLFWDNGTNAALNSGNFGIGTTSPAATLDVVGNLKVSGITTFNGIGYTWPSTGGNNAQVLSTNGNGTLSWTTQSGGVGGSGNVNFLARFSAGTTLGNSLFWDNGTNAALASGKLGIGTTSPLNRLDVSGAVAIGSLPTTALTQSNMLYVSGNLGIGTSNPSAPLEVVGNIVGSGNLTVSTGNITLANTSGGVTIGNASGTLALTSSGFNVTSGGALSGVSTLSMSSQLTNTAANTAAINLSGNGAGLAFGGTGFNQISTSGSNNLAILPGGNVGIGTTGPGAKLEVAGQVKITGGSPGLNKVLTSDTVGLASWTDIASAGGVTGTGNTNFIARWNSNTALNSSLLWDNGTNAALASGNLGVGSTSPLNKLDISGSAAIGSLPTSMLPQSNMLYVSGNVGIGITSPSTTLGVIGNLAVGGVYGALSAPSSGAIFEGSVGIGTSNPGTASLAVMNGNVGIGTTNPGAKLHVNGSGLFGTDMGYATLSSLQLSSTTASSYLVVGQGASNNLEFNWLYNATPANAVGQLATYGFSNPIKIDGSSLLLQTLSGGNVGIGVTAPARKLDILDASNPQLRLTQTAQSLYSEFQVAATTGDLTLQLYGTNANNITLASQNTTAGVNLWVCEGTACPAVSNMTGGGNIIPERAIYFVGTGSSAFKVGPTASSKQLGVYDSAGNTIIVFDED